MQQSPDKSFHSFEPSEIKLNPASGIEQLESVSVLGNSKTQFRDKYPWMTYVTDGPIDYNIFDIRAQNVLKHSNCTTWGHLGGLTDEALYRMRNIGELTVGRINEALKNHLPDNIRNSTTEEPVPSEYNTGAILPDPETYIAIEWARAFTDDDTLGGLLQAHQSGIDVPLEVVAAIDTILATPIPKLSGHRVPQLGDLIDELINEANDPDLFVARECSRHKPTLEELGVSRRLTRERIRQIVATDAERVRKAISYQRFRPLRWGVERFNAELGLVIPADHCAVERWKTRLGDDRFEILRWIAGYIYKDQRLQRGANAWADLLKVVNDVIGDEWLINANDVLCEVVHLVLPDVVQSTLVDSGGWRDIGDGWLVKWDGTLLERAERVLRLTCKPMTPAELIEAIGYGSIGSLKNIKGSSLMRVDKAFRLALRDWGMEEYEGIVTEIEQRIDRGGGVASKSAIIDEFTRDFGVSITSITMNLGLPIFNVVGDSVRFADSFSFDPLPPLTVGGAVQTAYAWGERQTVTEDHMRGYSFDVNPHIAWANGLRPSDSLIVSVNSSSLYEASVKWRIAKLNGKIEVGRLREWLEDRKVGPGTSLLLCPTPTGVHVYVGEDDIQAARPAAPPIPPDIAAMMEDL